jgi:hypothetical protein
VHIASRAEGVPTAANCFSRADCLHTKASVAFPFPFLECVGVGEGAGIDVVIESGGDV